MARIVLDLERFVPATLTQIGNKWARSSSRIYLEKFDVGINEWRVISILAVENAITANRICTVVGMDKALIGRTVQNLQEKGYVTQKPKPDDGRSRLISLTASGYVLHDKIIKIALGREKQLLASFTSKEINTLIELLDRVRINIVRMQSDEES